MPGLDPGIHVFLALRMDPKDQPVIVPPEEIAELDRRWNAIKAGEPTVPHEEVERWLRTWGKPEFKPWSGQTSES